MSLFVYASNPAAVAPDQNAVLRGLEREDLFTVVHERFLTDTARYADVVLPAPSSLETSDLFRSYGQYCAQRVRPAIERVGESRSNWETFQLLARAMGFSEPIFGQSEDQLIDELIAKPSPWREGVDAAALQAGRAVELRVPEQGWATPSGKIELRNDRHREPLPRYLANHADADLLPLRLMTAPALNTLNSTFQERDELRQRAKSMRLKLSAAEASRRGLLEGSKVLAFNALGEVPFELEITDAVPDGVAVAEGVWWIAHAPGKRTVNALVSQRLTDEGAGATFYDNRIDVRPA
jgi:anaerobic selenocysteine-containing dehydrogenase